MKFRKKPVVIEAFQWRKGEYPQDTIIPEWWIDAMISGVVYYEDDSESLNIRTLEGDMRVKDMDYIIYGTHGELYPCRVDIFEANYKKVE